MLKSRCITMVGRSQIKNWPTILDRFNTASAEAFAITKIFYIVNNRFFWIARVKKIAMERVHSAI
ncbi:Uncharacterised protein [Vibrio cholerae]|nr:Uncharacterised protein [Vibrio cholerae]